jgi:fructose-bisphosphate aldolase, class I
VIDTNIARQLVAGDKGVLAIDESIATCNRRFAALGIAQTVEERRRYREILITTPGLAESISGAILSDETIHQQTADGTTFLRVLGDAGILVGIKVDSAAHGLAGHPGETVTEGLDGLRDRLRDYFQLGARFAKWRGVIHIAAGLPSRACIDANAHALSRYAALCQESGLVPIVEPEVLMDGAHTLERCREVTTQVLHATFDQLILQGVALEGMILKPNMVVPGSDCAIQESSEEIARATLRCLLEAVPAAVPGIAFLSGGQSAQAASANLNAMHILPGLRKSPLPWALTFSFGRALQEPAISIWGGRESQRMAAQQALLQRARCNSAARRGEYAAAMERS